MVIFRRIEIFCRLNFRDNFSGISAGSGKFFCRGSCRFFLLRIGIKYRRPILGAHIVALPVKAGGVVQFPEVLQQPFISYDCRIIGNADSFGMSGFAAADLFIRGGFNGSAGVTRFAVDDAFYPAEILLHAPETAGGKNGRFGRFAGWSSK